MHLERHTSEDYWPVVCMQVEQRLLEQRLQAKEASPDPIEPELLFAAV